MPSFKLINCCTLINDILISSFIEQRDISFSSFWQKIVKEAADLDLNESYLPKMI